MEPLDLIGIYPAVTRCRPPARTVIEIRQDFNPAPVRNSKPGLGLKQAEISEPGSARGPIP